MSEKVYFKVIKTTEYIVEAESSSEAFQLYRNFSVWKNEDENAYELTSKDLKKYEFDYT